MYVRVCGKGRSVIMDSHLGHDKMDPSPAPGHRGVLGHLELLNVHLRHALHQCNDLRQARRQPHGVRGAARSGGR